MKRPPQVPQNPLTTLGNVLQLMEANLALFQPPERQIIQLARQWHAAGRMPGQDVLVQLGAAYQRVRAIEDQILQQAEEGIAYALGDEIDLLQVARTMLDAGRILDVETVKRLQLVHMRTMLPQILESLEHQSMLLQDREYALVQHARAVMELGGGQVDRNTLQQLVNLQNILQIRQYAS